MDVRLVGDGPAVDAVRAALADAAADVEVREGTPSEVGDADVAVVVGTAGAAAFETANAAAGRSGVRWLMVEFGGLGGVPLDGLDASVTGFGPGSGCFDCLQSRVLANADAVGDERPVEASVRRFAGAVAGRAAVSLVEGDDAPVGRVVEVPHANREFLRVPTCECAGERDRSLTRTYEDVGLDDAIERAERTMDERVGVVHTIGELESFPAPYYLAQNADTSGFSDVQAPRQAAGVHSDWNTAFMKAVGEALERYSAGVYRTAAFPTAPLATLRDGPGPTVVSPEAFVRPADAPAVDVSEPIRWVPGADLTDGSPVSLPAEAVHFPPPEERYLSAITTGLGLGTSPVGAMLSGLYEVVERDATMLAWYSTFEPLELTVDDEEFRTLARRARAEDLSVTTLLVTQDVDVPVVAAAVHRDDEWPRFAVGSGANLDPVRAARSALGEALQNWMELRSMGPEASANEAGAIGRYADFPREAREFLDAGGPIPAESVGPDDPPTGVAELDALVSRVADVGLTPYAARVTPGDVADVGFEAVRVVAPGAQPLFTDDPFFGTRARSVPRELGFEPRLDREHHPYP